MAAHVECLQVLVIWHDPRTKRIFMAACLAMVALLLEVPMKVVMGVRVKSEKRFNLFH